MLPVLSSSAFTQDGQESEGIAFIEKGLLSSKLDYVSRK